jgi:tRNA 2-selenouridine synthase
MRSAAIAWLMDLHGFKVTLLTGGYKRFRNYILNTFSIPFEFKILGGYTGSGKTEQIRVLKEKGENVIDLEGLANHKGSAFGSIGMPAQPSQEMFENKLGLELRAVSREPVWLEDEAQRIGLVNIPTDLWRTMRLSPVFFLDIPFEERLTHLVEEYGCLDKQKMIDAITRISEKLGGLNAKNAINYLNEGNTIESFHILLKYYDKHYLKALHNRNNLNSLLQRIECKSVILENASQLIHSSHLIPQKV